MGQCWTKLCNRATTTTDDDSDTASDLAGGNVRLINKMEMWERETSEANKDGKIMVVNFSAAWCNPCRQIAPAYRELSEKHPSILFLTVDVDELARRGDDILPPWMVANSNAEFSSSWDIKATPTFFFLKEGRHLDKLVGANKMELQKKTSAIAEPNTRSSPHRTP